VDDNTFVENAMIRENIRTKLGDTISFHYVGKDEDDIIFDTTRGEIPLKITLGKSEILPAVESALIGMAVGETKQVHIPSSEAYGPLRSELVLEIPKRRLPANLIPAVGMQLKIPLKRLTTPLTTTILAVGEFSITLNANHPLAGKDLIYDIELMRIHHDNSENRF